MTEKQSLLQDAMSELSSALRNSVGASSSIRHQLLKGEFRERRVIAGLRPFIPRRYEMSSGVVINSAGEHSGQQDVILSDSMVSPPFLAAGELGVHPIEAVSGVVEVKSRATPEEMRSAVRNVASVKRLMSDDLRPIAGTSQGTVGAAWARGKPFGGIILLDRSGSDEALLQAFTEEADKLGPSDRPNSVVLINDFVIFWAMPLPGSSLPVMQFHLTPEMQPLHRPLGKDSLLIFYLALMRTIGTYQPPGLDLASYIAAGPGLGNG